LLSRFSLVARHTLPGCGSQAPCNLRDAVATCDAR
jgi:hypothetical protein